MVKLNDQQKRALIGIGVVVMIIIIAVVVIQTTREEEAEINIPKQEVPAQAIPSQITQELGAKSALDYLNESQYWSGDVGASINGTIVAVDPVNGIVIFESDEDGALYYTRITDLTDLYIGDAPATLSDFRVGMPITVMYEPYYVEATE